MPQSDAADITEQERIPQSLRSIAAEFVAVSDSDKMQLLLEFSDDLPEVPQHYADHPELLEPVPECQSPVAVIAEVTPASDAGRVPSADTSIASLENEDISNAGESSEAKVTLVISAPPEAPTTRGFAGILHAGLNGCTPSQVLAVPAEFPYHLDLEKAVSPLRLRGMTGMLLRIQDQVAKRCEPRHGH